MRYDFSAEFLRILPPDTSFGEAWESLCELLLRKELGTTNLIRFKPPDCGVDLLYRSERKAFQCKGSERGFYGTIDAEDSARSLETAIRHRAGLEWIKYCFATNADYTGSGYKKILQRGRERGLTSEDLEFLGPAYWDQLCIAHSDLVDGRFDYRVTVDEKHLLEALQKHVPTEISKALSSLEKNPLESVVISNNLNEVELELQLLAHLSVEAYLRATIELLGLSPLVNSEFGLALMPLFSVRFRGRELSLFVSLKDLSINSGDKLEFHTKLGADALAVYEKIIKHFPGNVIAKTSRAEILVSMGRLDEALSSYETIIAEHPENVAAKVGRAETLKAFGRLNDALAVFESIIAEHPADVVAKNGYAELLKTMGQLDSALMAYDHRLVKPSADSVTADHPLKEDTEIRRSETDESREHVTRSIEEMLQDAMWEAAKRLRLAEYRPNLLDDRSSKLAA